MRCSSAYPAVGHGLINYIPYFLYVLFRRSPVLSASLVLKVARAARASLRCSLFAFFFRSSLRHPANVHLGGTVAFASPSPPPTDSRNSTRPIHLRPSSPATLSHLVPIPCVVQASPSSPDPSPASNPAFLQPRPRAKSRGSFFTPDLDFTLPLPPHSIPRKQQLSSELGFYRQDGGHRNQPTDMEIHPVSSACLLFCAPLSPQPAVLGVARLPGAAQRVASRPS